MSRFAFGPRRLAQGQADPKMSASRLRFEDFDAAAMRVHELRHHREADSSAFHVATLRRLSLVERLEDSVALFGRYTRPAIHDVQYQLLAFTAGVNRDCAAARGEFDCIGQEIVEDE